MNEFTEAVIDAYDKLENKVEVDNYVKSVTTSIMLENNRFAREHLTTPASDELVSKVFQGLRIYDWVSVQPMLGPAGIIESVSPSLPGFEGEEIALVAKTRKVLNYHSDQDVVAKLLIASVEREVFTDLRNNCGTVATLDWNDIGVNQLFDKLWELSGVISTKLYRKYQLKYVFPNWLITSPKLANYLEDRTKDKWKIYTCEAANDDIVMGYKGNNSEAGYYYCPYFLTAPMAEGSYLMRYGKKLIRSGSMFYAKMTINNLPEEL